MEICLIIIGPAPHNDFVKLTEYGESAYFSGPLEMCLIGIWLAPHNDSLKLAEYSKSALGRVVPTERLSVKGLLYFSGLLEMCLIGIC